MHPRPDRRFGSPSVVKKKKKIVAGHACLLRHAVSSASRFKQLATSACRSWGRYFRCALCITFSLRCQPLSPTHPARQHFSSVDYCYGRPFISQSCYPLALGITLYLSPLPSRKAVLFLSATSEHRHGRNFAFARATHTTPPLLSAYVLEPQPQGQMWRGSPPAHPAPLVSPRHHTHPAAKSVAA